MQDVELTTMTTGSEEFDICPTCGEPTEFEISLPWGTRRRDRNCRCAREETEEQREVLAAAKHGRWAERLRGRWEMNPARTFDAWDSSRQPSMHGVWDRVRKFAQTFAEIRPDHGLLLRGPTKGTGKSHLLMAAANYLIEHHGIEAISVELPDLLDQQRPRRAGLNDDERDDRWEQVMAVPFLALNDVSRFKPTEWTCDKLFRLLDKRINRRLCTCFSANQRLSDWSASVSGKTQDEKLRLADLVDACVSRIDGCADLVVIPDEAVDYRHLLRLDRKRKETNSNEIQDSEK